VEVDESLFHGTSLTQLGTVYSEKNYLFLRQAYISTKGQYNQYLNQICSLHRPIGSNTKLSIKLQNKAELIASELLQTGYFSLPGYFNPTLCDDLLHYLSTLSYQSGRSRCDARPSSIFCYELTKRLLTDPFIKRVADLYLNVNSILYPVYCWKTRPFKDNEANASRDALMYHIDHDYNRFLKVFVYLNDVSLDNGPHTYCPQTSFKNLPAFVDCNRRFSCSEIDSAGLRQSSIIGSAGTIIFADTLNIHKGTPVKSGERYILQVQFTDSLVGAELRDSSLYRAYAT
jgi:hypothetical protein